MRSLAIGALALTFTALLIGCGGPDKTSSSTATTDLTPTKEAPTGEGKLDGKVDVQAFKGGYGIDFYQAAAKEFDAKSGTQTTVDGNPRVWESLRLRFISGDVPDLVFPGWGMDHWALAEEGQLMTLDKALDSKPYGGTGEWRDTFEPTLLALGQNDGKQYVLPYYFNVLGWWYDPGVFAKNGWTPPKTYDDLLALCTKIKAKGMAPITFQGKYPYYMIQGMLMPWLRDVGGQKAAMDAQNLEPGAWKSPAMLKAATMIDELNKKGFFQTGAVAMSHTESQQEFLQGHAAMIPCGTWLSSEEKNSTPPGAKMEFMLPPAVPGEGDPSAVIIGIEPWMVPADAKNANAGVALFKYMTSLDEAKKFVKEKATLMAIKGSDADLPEVLKVASEKFKASKGVWALQYRDWYTKFDTETQNALTSMLNGQLTPQAFCDRCEKEAQKVRDDIAIKKHKVTA
ncbi:N-acetylglucosamine/diacetylchitobiose ABC transporter substrate-binding protein [soil metagenome]